MFRSFCFCVMVGQSHFRQVMLLITAVIFQSAFLYAEDTLPLLTAPNFLHHDSLQSVEFVDEDDWYGGKHVTYNDGVILLNPDPRQEQTRYISNIGKIIYPNEVQFKYPGYGMISFETSFTFQIITANPYALCGSGMIFFIADYYKAPKSSYGRYFGLVSPDRTSSSRFFAIEFDTHETVEFADPSASHIGIDIDSLNSKKYVDSSPNASSGFYPELYLYSNTTFTAWIKYNKQATLIEVWMNSTNLLVRPSSPCLSLQYNLSDVFEDYMYVGLSASSNASEDGMEGVNILAWNLTVYPPSIEHKLNIPLVVSLLLLVLCGGSFYLICKAKIKKERRAADQAPSLQISRRDFVNDLISQTSVQEYRLEELLLASQGFCESNEIGEGTFSVVYKATLADGKTVAIKRLKARCKREQEFSDEIRVITEMRHKNLLALRGWCYDAGEALLIYDYMSRGSLSGYLYGTDKGSLSSNVRQDILAGVGAALEYLHEDLGDCVLHRDVKAANVLLSEEWRAVLGDFGLARLVRHSEGSVAMSVGGSPGYIAPEVVFSNKVTPKADVYSFGVLLLVVASGRPAVLSPSIRGSESSELLLVDWMWRLHQSNQIMECLDPALVRNMAEVEKVQWGRILHIAMACIDGSPQLRPTMGQVCRALEGQDVRWMHDRARARKGACYEAGHISFSSSQALYLHRPRNVSAVSPVDAPGAGQWPSSSYCQTSSATFGQGEHWEGR